MNGGIKIKPHTFASIFIIIGIILIIGTRLNIKLIADPPEKWALFYTLSRIKKRSGLKALHNHNYIVGTIFIILGIYIIFRQ